MSGFAINDFDHLDEAKQPGLEHRREVSGWGFVKTSSNTG